MANNLTARLLFAVTLAVTLAVSAQAATKDQYKAALGSDLFSFYDYVCKPGSLNPEAKKLVELIISSSPSDLNSRARAEINQAAEKFGSNYCLMLDQMMKGTLDTFNAKAKLPGAEQMVKADLDRFNAEAKLPGADHLPPPKEPEPNWRTMTMDECAATLDAKLAKRDQELNPRDMFKACDSLTKGFAVQMMSRPRQGTAAGDRVNECMRKYYARTPMSYQQPEKVIEIMCQRPGGL
jgi:hypothetical protein